MAMTPSTLRTECQTCGDWAEFTGRTSTIGERTYAIAYCAQCRVEIPFWTPHVERLVAAFERARMLRAIAERLCGVATGAEQEIRAALAMPARPAPLGADECEITAGVLSRASVELRFSRAPLSRNDLDGVFGQAEALPRTGPGAAHNLVYDVRVSGAPACVAVFASFHERPLATSEVKRILLRIDPA
jgi:hypothetical protein